MLSTKDISEKCAELLDKVGYSEGRVQQRIHVMDNAYWAAAFTTPQLCKAQDIDSIRVGSKREGISLAGESDTDYLQVRTSVVCTDRLRNIKGTKVGRVIFRLDKKTAPPGYTYLRYIANDNKHGQISNPVFETLERAFTETPYGVYLSSEKYMKDTDDMCIPHKCFSYQKGPAIRICANGEEDFDSCFKVDCVRCFPCYCPSLLNTWLSQRRFHDWPCEDTKREIKTLPCYVVPVGHSHSEFEHLQWRISFVMAEITLVRSLNETQRKMLIILRLVAKHILKPVCADIDSYIMKNVTFWIVELTPASKFTNNQLIDRVLDAIDFLTNCIKRKWLSKYMIPGRNLLHGKVQNKRTVKNILCVLQKLRTFGQAVLSGIFQTPHVSDLVEKSIQLIPTYYPDAFNEFLLLICDPISTWKIPQFIHPIFKDEKGVVLMD